MVVLFTHRTTDPLLQSVIFYIKLLIGLPFVCPTTLDDLYITQQKCLQYTMPMKHVTMTTYPDRGNGFKELMIGVYQFLASKLMTYMSLLQPSGCGSGLGYTPPNTHNSPRKRLQL